MNQQRLASLYADLAELLESRADRALLRRDLDRICKQYGSDNVAWMMGVVADDLAAAAELEKS